MGEEKSPKKRKREPFAGAPRCRGVLAGGKPCPNYARYPEDNPEWCWNCDPTKREERRAKGAQGGRPVEAERTPKALAAGQTATVDRIVTLCLEAAVLVRKGKLPPMAGNALARLYAKALDGIKARATTGDARAVVHRDSKPSKVVQPSGDLETLQKILDA